jgi:DNA-3-methyladenine glycosylase
MKMTKIKNSFFQRDVLEICPELLGKILVRKFDDGIIKKYKITEIEAYKGEKDLACHASKGRTKRTEIMYHDGGFIYVYLIYGIHWMLNIVTSIENHPQAILIRGIENFNGPGKLGKELKIDNSFYGENLENSTNIWIENNDEKIEFSVAKRIGIEYAGEFWKNKFWRFFIK